MSEIKKGTADFKRLEVAMSNMIDAALPRASDIDDGYFFEASMFREGQYIGDYKVTIQRTKKP